MFEKQAKFGLVECPLCGDSAVSRALMAPAVAARDASPEPAPAPSRQRGDPPPMGA